MSLRRTSKFLRLAFCDVYGKQKNISIQPDELERAFEYGIAFDASAVPGFGSEIHSDLFLQPDTGTLCVLPWRPDHGRVVRMFCSILHPDGTPFASDTRRVLQNAVDAADGSAALSFSFGSEMEFYLFQRDENGEADPRPLRPRRLYGHCAGGQGREHPAGDLPDAQPDGDSPGMFAPRTGSGAE